MTMRPARALEVATSIAAELDRSAFEHEGRCTWMGTTQDLAPDGVSLAFTHRTLGPDLYGGTAGIALFLAECGRLTGEARFRRRAAAAIRHACSRVAPLRAAGRFGFYDGLTGIAYAAAAVGRANNTPELMTAARELLAPLGPGDLDAMGLDVIDGAAGAAPALLVLAAWLDSPRLVELARHLGRRIMAGARKTPDGWSWAFGDTDAADAHHLTGLSHGAAGMGWALLELHAATGEPDFRAGALEAFRYEDRWFRPDEDNWPDFREHAGDPALAPCAHGWCHGAPGIGLVRLKALARTGDTQFARDAKAAVRSTSRWLEQREGGDSDFSPCHGRSGAAEFLLGAADAVGAADARRLAMGVADHAARRYGRTPGAWPCGVQKGQNPSLMIGSAGTGYFYLRVADPTVPSLLLVGPDGR